MPHHPVYSSDTTPIYSNAAFQLLAYAFETITGTEFNKTLIQTILEPLNMTRSFLLDPFNETDNFIVPIGPDFPPAEVWWNQSLGEEDP